MQEKLYPEAIYGFRVWRVDWSGRLRSLCSNYLWQKGDNYALCYDLGFDKRDHEAPSRYCACGFSALYSGNIKVGSGLVLGMIAGRGMTQLHEDGFRVEFARILALSGNSYRTKKAARRYNLPILSRAEFVSKSKARTGWSVEKSFFLGTKSFIPGQESLEKVRGG